MSLINRLSEDQSGPAYQRVLHVLVPELVFNHVKAQAALSGLPFKEYMERFLMEARPYAVEALEGNNASDTQ